MENQNVTKILSLTSKCYKNLETIEAMANLLTEKFMEDKDAAIALEIIANSAQTAVDSILQIQKEL